MPSKFRTIEIESEGLGRRRLVRACRDCGRKVMWCKTAAGKWIPFDEMPELAGEQPTDRRLESVSTEMVHFGRCSARRPATTTTEGR